MIYHIVSFSFRLTQWSMPPKTKGKVVAAQGPQYPVPPPAKTPPPVPPAAAKASRVGKKVSMDNLSTTPGTAEEKRSAAITPMPDERSEVPVESAGLPSVEPKKNVKGKKTKTQ